MSQEVHDYIQGRSQEWQVEICERLDQLVHQSIPEVEERLQYSKPHYRKNGKYACVIGTAKDWVTFTIFNATEIEGPEGFFEPGPPERKTVKIRKGQAVDYDLLAKLVQQASQSL